jgi:hypothetical protein
VRETLLKAPGLVIGDEVFMTGVQGVENKKFIDESLMSLIRERNPTYVPRTVIPNLELYLGLVNYTANPERGNAKLSDFRRWFCTTKFGMPQWAQLPEGTWAELQEQLNLAVRPTSALPLAPRPLIGSAASNFAGLSPPSPQPSPRCAVGLMPN